MEFQNCATPCTVDTVPFWSGFLQKEQPELVMKFLAILAAPLTWDHQICPPELVFGCLTTSIDFAEKFAESFVGHCERVLRFMGRKVQGR